MEAAIAPFFALLWYYLRSSDLPILLFIFRRTTKYKNENTKQNLLHNDGNMRVDTDIPIKRILLSIIAVLITLIAVSGLHYKNAILRDRSKSMCLFLGRYIVV